MCYESFNNRLTAHHNIYITNIFFPVNLQMIILVEKCVSHMKTTHTILGNTGSDKFMTINKCYI